MYPLSISLTLLALCICVLSRPQTDKYTTKYDEIEVDEILNNKRLLNPYVECALETGPCTKEAKELKGICALCNICLLVN